MQLLKGANKSKITGDCRKMRRRPKPNVYQYSIYFISFTLFYIYVSFYRLPYKTIVFPLFYHIYFSVSSFHFLYHLLFFTIKNSCFPIISISYIFHSSFYQFSYHFIFCSIKNALPSPFPQIAKRSIIKMVCYQIERIGILIIQKGMKGEDLILKFKATAQT